MSSPPSTVNKKNRTFWLLTGSVFIVLFLPWLLQQGMFFDGVTYSAIAKNLAYGYGSFWKPHYTQTLHPAFYDHPPLVFGLQSLFFKVLGDGFITERIYSLATALLTAAGIVLLWRLFAKEEEIGKLSWMPVLLWVMTPIVVWTYRNNLLENPLGVFTIFSVYFICRSLLHKQVVWLILGSTLLVAAFLSKGFVGLFPMGVAVLFWLTIDNRKVQSFILYTLASIFLPLLLFYTIWLLSPGLQENITGYMEQQLLPSLNKEREVTTGNRFSILLQLVVQLAFPLLLLLILFARQFFKTKQYSFRNKKEAIFFLLVGLSASLPLIVSLKQRSFYLVPSIPYFMLGISFLIVPHVISLLKQLSQRWLLWLRVLSFAAMVFAAVFAVIRAGTSTQDQMLIHDVEVICATVPEGTVISTSGELWMDWELVAYLSRHGNLSLDNIFEHEYFLLRKSAKPEIGEAFEKMDLNLVEFSLFRRVSPPPDGKINELRKAEFGR